MTGRQPQRGLGLVELMVSLALGLFVTATMLTLAVGHLRENRALVLEARLTHDLQAALDLIARDLRRAGYWGAAELGVVPDALANPYAELTSAGSDVVFAFSRDEAENGVVDTDDRFGFRLQNQVLQMQLGGTWQALTDAQRLAVQRLTLTPRVDELPLGGFCAKACPASDPACPRQRIRRMSIELDARSALDARVTRSLRAEVRLRNDATLGACPA